MQNLLGRYVEMLAVVVAMVVGIAAASNFVNFDSTIVVKFFAALVYIITSVAIFMAVMEISRFAMPNAWDIYVMECTEHGACAGLHAEGPRAEESYAEGSHAETDRSS